MFDEGSSGGGGVRGSGQVRASLDRETPFTVFCGVCTVQWDSRTVSVVVRVQLQSRRRCDKFPHLNVKSINLIHFFLIVRISIHIFFLNSSLSATLKW